MYLKHKAEMVEGLLPIGLYIFAINLTYLKCLLSKITATLTDVFRHALEYLDGSKSKDEIYQQVYEDLHNTLLNHL